MAGMPRANRRRPDPAPFGSGATGSASAGAPGSALGTTTERYAGSLWSVRRVSGVRATREYRCPGCQQEIAIGVPHVVAWPAEGVGGLGDRRHWHTGCWQRRDARPAGNAYR